MFIVLRFKEKKGHWPLLKPKASGAVESGSVSGSSGHGAYDAKRAPEEKTVSA